MILSAQDLRQKNHEELVALLREERGRLAQIRMKMHVAPLANTKEIHAARKNIARIITLLHAQ